MTTIKVLPRTPYPGKKERVNVGYVAVAPGSVTAGTCVPLLGTTGAMLMAAAAFALPEVLSGHNGEGAAVANGKRGTSADWPHRGLNNWELENYLL